MSYSRISVLEARLLLESHGDAGVQIADVRDEQAYQHEHIPHAVHVDNNNLQNFIDNADLGVPLLVYCYHGHISQGAASYLNEQGFNQAYSLDGGYEAWKTY